MMSTKSAQGQLRAARKRLKRACRSGKGKVVAMLAVHDAAAVLTYMEFARFAPQFAEEQEQACTHTKSL